MSVVDNFELMLNQKYRGVDEKYRKNTTLSYRNDIKNFVEYLQEKNETEDIEKIIINIGKKDAIEYVNYLQEKYKPSTVNRNISALMKFYDYIVDIEELMNRNPFTKELKISSIVVDKYKDGKDILTIEECKSLIQATYKRGFRCRDFEFNSTRDRALLSIYITNGARCEEVLNSNVSDLEKIENGYALNIGKNQVKNKIDKRLIIVGQGKKYLDDYLYVRELQGITSKNLFVSIEGNKIDNKNMNRIIKKYTKIANIGKNISVHCFRDTCTSILRLRNISDSVINLVLGWKDSTMLRLYSTQDLTIYDEIKAEACDFL